MDTGARAFRLEIDLTRTPIGGRLTPESPAGADAVGFTGWTGLAATLELLLTGDRHGPVAKDEIERGTR